MRVAELFVYPIKGCRGRAVRTAVVDELGLVGDRRLMLVDDDGGFLSQREVPALATLQPELDGADVTVTAPGCAAFRMTLDPDGPRLPVTVWGGSLIAHDQGDAAAGWFSAALRHSCRLVRFGPASRNPVDPQYSPRPGAETAFTDGYPMLAVLEESLADLNTRLAEPVPMARFRPNTVLRGAPAWSEDGWRVLTIADLTWDQAKPCARCVVTITDQISGQRDPDQEPLRTLATFRTLPGFGAIFGQNMVPRTTGRLAVGDEVRVA